MGRSKSLIRFTGSIGEIRSYYDSDIKDWVYSTKGGANKELIKNNKAFARTRELNVEWKGNAKWAKAVRIATNGLNNLKQGRNNCNLLKIGKKIQTMDYESDRGVRRIESSRFNYPLSGFSMSKKHPFSEVFYGSYELSVTDDRNEVTLALNNFISRTAFSWPETIRDYRVYFSISVVPDYEWHEPVRAYEPVYFPFSDEAKTIISEWQLVSYTPTDIQMSLKFDDGFIPQERSIVIVALGFEFATMIENGSPYIVKDHGSMAIIGCV
jgi:hypothetical protein